MLLELLLLVLGLLLVWDYYNKKHRLEILERSGIPGPKVLPILGNAWDIRHIDSDSKYFVFFKQYLEYMYNML